MYRYIIFAETKIINSLKSIFRSRKVKYFSSSKEGFILFDDIEPLLIPKFRKYDIQNNIYIFKKIDLKIYTQVNFSQRKHLREYFLCLKPLWNEIMDSPILNSKQKEVLRMRYKIGVDKEYSLQEIADKFGLTKSRIYAIELSALKKIKKKYN